MFNIMLFEISAKIALSILLPIMFTLNTLYKLFVPSKYEKAQFYFKFLMYLISFILTNIFVLPVFVFKPRDPSNMSVFNPFFNYVFENCLGIELIIRNKEELEKERGAVVVQNHQSSIELLMNLYLWPIAKRIIGISKMEMKYIFPVGQAYYLAGSRFIDRKDQKQAFEEIKIIARELREKKAKVWMFPEGTRNHDREKFLQFKKGAFYMAVTAQAPILPIVCSPYYFLKYDTPSFKNGKIIMQILDPVPTEGLTVEDIPQLVETVRARMLDEYKKLYDEVMPDGPI